MDVTDITPQLDKLDGQLDHLEDVLGPLLGDLGAVAAKLPLLEKAKLYVLATYSIESLLFSSLRLNGVDAKEHPVFRELARVRQYFDKIKAAETPVEKRENSVDKQAAIRFLRADLADNPDVKAKLAEQLAKERERAAARAGKGEKRSAEEPPSSDNPETANGGSASASKKRHGPKKSKSKK